MQTAPFGRSSFCARPLCPSSLPPLFVRGGNVRQPRGRMTKQVVVVDTALVAPSEETPRQPLWLSNLDLAVPRTHTPLRLLPGVPQRPPPALRHPHLLRLAEAPRRRQVALRARRVHLLRRHRAPLALRVRRARSGQGRRHRRAHLSGARVPVVL
ncbi:Anthranilate N-benzoyltransferase protein 1 [Zea mays]|uniref:Anthranilate N-benzoyltransferase protein 1 n=1 Tax=Zea mays TaxID=4577 RepID=A0A1D6Q1Q7_MAIZE|nr:Anthranilate N-benzoyltransferase protein 1 [Zea mays]